MLLFLYEKIQDFQGANPAVAPYVPGYTLTTGMKAL